MPGPRRRAVSILVASVLLATGCARTSASPGAVVGSGGAPPSSGTPVAAHGSTTVDGVRPRAEVTAPPLPTPSAAAEATRPRAVGPGSDAPDTVEVPAQQSVSTAATGSATAGGSHSTTGTAPGSRTGSTTGIAGGASTAGSATGSTAGSTPGSTAGSTTGSTVGSAPSQATSSPRTPPASRPASPDRPSAPPPVPAAFRHVLGWTGSGRVVSLTFDDGPGPYTAQVLDVLADKKVPATFCQIGEQVAEYPSVEKRIVAMGDVLCDHSWDHDEHLSERPAADIDSEIDRTRSVIAAVAGRAPVYYRAPGGDFGDPVKLAAARSDLPLLGWSVDPRDWARPGVDAIVAGVLNAVTPGAIVLLHDGGGDRSETVAALPRIIDGLRARGYTFITPAPHPAT